jgi:hypothetical protein
VNEKDVFTTSHSQVAINRAFFERIAARSTPYGVLLELLDGTWIFLRLWQ